MRHSQEGELAEGGGALRRAAVERNQRSFCVAGRGERKGEAGDLGLGTIGPHDNQRRVLRFPVGRGHGLRADALESELAKAVLYPLLCPPIGGIARTSDALPEDLFDPVVDLVLRRNGVLA
jgi:hypothetical protein